MGAFESLSTKGRQLYFFTLFIVCNEQIRTIDYASQKNIFSISNDIKILNKQCSLDLDVASCVYLDILNIIKLHHRYIIVMIR